MQDISQRAVASIRTISGKFLARLLGAQIGAQLGAFLRALAAGLPMAGLMLSFEPHLAARPLDPNPHRKPGPVHHCDAWDLLGLCAVVVADRRQGHGLVAMSYESSCLREGVS